MTDCAQGVTGELATPAGDMAPTTARETVSPKASSRATSISAARRSSSARAESPRSRSSEPRTRAAKSSASRRKSM